MADTTTVAIISIVLLINACSGSSCGQARSGVALLVEHLKAFRWPKLCADLVAVAYTIISSDWIMVRDVVHSRERWCPGKRSRCKSQLNEVKRAL